ncbi:unnamed protein product, partial [Linum tenue]
SSGLASRELKHRTPRPVATTATNPNPLLNQAKKATSNPTNPVLRGGLNPKNPNPNPIVDASNFHLVKL